MITVKSGTVFDGENTYKPGDIVSGLSVEDENRLAELGVAELLPDFIVSEEDEPPKGDEKNEEDDADADVDDELEEATDSAEDSGPDTSLPGLDEQAPKAARKSK